MVMQRQKYINKLIKSRKMDSTF